jgi:putative flippase GtrA
MTLFTRWLRFNAGGLYGFLLQLFILTLLSRRLPLAAATAIAVEAAIMHNFVWHELFTWKERHVTDVRSIVARFLRFQLANGCISLVGNVVLTTYLHRVLHLPAVLANVIAIGACSTFNFVAGEWIVFKKAKKTYPEDRRMLFV